MHNFCLVQLTPKDMRGQESINIGFEIIKSKIEECGWNCDVAKFGDKIDKDKYDIIGFNIFYVTQQLNLIPFMRENNIEPIKEKRNKQLIIAGGQGITNPRTISKFIDIFVHGDGEENIVKILKAYENQFYVNLEKEEGIWMPEFKMPITFAHIDKIESKPVIFSKRGMIELTRGCKYRCKFCAYGWTQGKYREKDLDLVKEQIQELKSKNIRTINFLSCNLCGYSRLKELLQYCVDENINAVNSDMRINEFDEEIAILLDKLKIRTLKVGLETFCEQTRKDINKNISTEQLERFIDLALMYNVSNLHFYLIYGLPTEKDYEDWFYYVKYLKEKIKDIPRSIRIELSITNFEPSLYTPYQDEAYINFKEKDKFLEKYLKCLEENDYIKDASTKCYANMHGRIGRKPESYAITMWLLHGDEHINDVLYKLNTKGATRSIKPPLYRKILKLDPSVDCVIR